MSPRLEEQWGFLSVICLILPQLTIQVHRENYANNVIKNMCFVKITILKKASSHNKVYNTKLKENQYQRMLLQKQRKAESKEFRRACTVY